MWGRSRREPRRDSSHVQCSLYLDADGPFFRQWGGDAATTPYAQRVAATVVRMVDVMYQVAAVYAIHANLGGTLELHV